MGLVEFLSNLLNRIPFRVILLATVLLTGGLLVAPDYWLAVLRLENLESEYGWLVGIGFAGSLALLVANALVWGWERLQGAREKHAREKAIRSNIDALDRHEKAVLREFYIQERNTIQVPIDNPVVAGLLRKEIISIVGECGKEVFNVGRPCPVALTLLASTLITPQIVGIPSGELTSEQSYNIARSRPDFVHYI